MNNHPKLLKAVGYAARKHTGQRRKGPDAAPYINHPIEVANLLIDFGGVNDPDILIAAILHDTVEDTDATVDEIREIFGERVSKIVAEVTDDKSLPKEKRKQAQIAHGPGLSDSAKQLKICDKISNITDIINNPPVGWSTQRKLEYVEWGGRVFEGLRGINPRLDEHFEKISAEARDKISKKS